MPLLPLGWVAAAAVSAVAAAVLSSDDDSSSYSSNTRSSNDREEQERKAAEARRQQKRNQFKQQAEDEAASLQAQYGLKEVSLLHTWFANCCDPSHQDPAKPADRELLALLKSGSDAKQSRCKIKQLQKDVQALQQAMDQLRAG